MYLLLNLSGTWMPELLLHCTQYADRVNWRVLYVADLHLTVSFQAAIYCRWFTRLVKLQYISCRYLYCSWGRWTGLPPCLLISYKGPTCTLSSVFRDGHVRTRGKKRLPCTCAVPQSTWVIRLPVHCGIRGRWRSVQSYVLLHHLWLLCWPSLLLNMSHSSDLINLADRFQLHLFSRYDILLDPGFDIDNNHTLYGATFICLLLSAYYVCLKCYLLIYLKKIKHKA